MTKKHEMVTERWTHCLQSWFYNSLFNQWVI